MERDGLPTPRAGEAPDEDAPASTGPAVEGRMVFDFDHTGIVVPDLEAAIAFYQRAFGAEVQTREADTDVDSDAIGLPGQRVRLRGALLRLGSSTVELHQYLEPTGTGRRRVCDTGIGHIALSVTDIDVAYAFLLQEGMEFNTEPQTISAGALAGRRWVYGRDPWGVVVELCQHAPGKEH